ncbi:MAG: hypothetical protein IPN81_03720 [Nitrosomonadales bacterium]|nr:hypothetical protein [Nitrosomonadales bacterium]
MKRLISKALKHRSLAFKPPVLIDVGASGSLPECWKLIAPDAICVAFDADTRDFTIAESSDKGFRKLYSLNRLVAAKAADEVEFYLTRSPYCSSSLPPDRQALNRWAFCGLFEVEKTTKMPAVDLKTALQAIDIDYVDWYKTDTQGTDLRIFDALPASMISNMIVAEFEPGIIDAYLGEDKLHQLMAYMDKCPFWVSSMYVKGSHRIEQEDLSSLNTLQRRSLDSFLKMAPGWCEISYINKFDSDSLGLREYLLGWVFSSINAEHGFALHLAKAGQKKFGEPLFSEMVEESLKCLSHGYFRVGLKALRKLTCMLKTKTW